MNNQNTQYAMILYSRVLPVLSPLSFNNSNSRKRNICHDIKKKKMLTQNDSKST